MATCISAGTFVATGGGATGGFGVAAKAIPPSVQRARPSSHPGAIRWRNMIELPPEHNARNLAGQIGVFARIVTSGPSGSSKTAIPASPPRDQATQPSKSHTPAPASSAGNCWRLRSEALSFGGEMV
jgi:hypothetical protein